MKTKFAATLVSALFTCLVGCASSAESDTEEGTDAMTARPAGASNDPRPQFANETRSVVMTEAGKEATIGAPAKIKAALKALDGNIVALDAAPRCGPPRFSLSFLAAPTPAGGAPKLASLQACSGKDVFLEVGAKWHHVPLAEAALRKVFAEPPAVGDLLAPASEVITMNAEGAGERQPALGPKKAFDLDAKLEARAAAQTPKCAPLMTLRFVAKSADVATVAVFCPKNEDDTAAPASITVQGKLVGWATFDIAKMLGAF